ncbi:MAG: DUF4416 family protein [Leptonema sp. (in: bacteria)]
MAKKWKPLFENSKLARLFIICAYDPENQSYLDKIKKKLVGFFDKIDFEINFASLLPVPSLYTIHREYSMYHLLSFQRLISREELVDIRLKTLSIELQNQKDGFPLIELDPGYVTGEQIVRTSLIEESHKIYLYKKVFAETLLYYDKGSFKPFIHTPKFFRSPDIITTFNDLRLIYVTN